MMLIVTSYESDINLIIVFVKKFGSLLPSITFKKKKNLAFYKIWGLFYDRGP